MNCYVLRCCAEQAALGARYKSEFERLQQQLQEDETGIRAELAKLSHRDVTQSARLGELERALQDSEQRVVRATHVCQLHSHL